MVGDFVVGIDSTVVIAWAVPTVALSYQHIGALARRALVTPAKATSHAIVFEKV
jgi:hypothetical protein